jgi:hypothetical protein
MHHKVSEMMTPPFMFWMAAVTFFSTLFGVAAHLVRKHNRQS